MVPIQSNPKETVLRTIRERFGEVSKLQGGNSLFSIGNDAARVYFRYSKTHENGQTFFGCAKWTFEDWRLTIHLFVF